VEPLSVVFPGTESNRFWFDDGSVILRVQETFYKMHRSLLEAHSKVLREKFLVGSPTQKRPDLYPIALEGFESHDFERFLTLIYPLDYTERETFASKEWVSILTVASQLQFESIRKLAIKHLSKDASDIDRVVLGHLYGVHEWLLSAYRALTLREESLTQNEGRRLGVDDVVRIAQARDRRRSDVFGSCSWGVMREIFGPYPIPDTLE